jgi:hypothetical protein
MPVNPADRPVPPGMLRRRGMRRLSAATTGVAVVSVLAAGTVATLLPGSTHTSPAASTAGTAGAHATSGSSGAAASQPGTSSSVHGSVTAPAASTTADRTDATSGGS